MSKHSVILVNIVMSNFAQDIWCSQHQVGSWTNWEDENDGKSGSGRTRRRLRETLIIFFLMFTQELFNQFFYHSIRSLSERNYETLEIYQTILCKIQISTNIFRFNLQTKLLFKFQTLDFLKVCTVFLLF